MVGGGKDAFIGAIHRHAAFMDGLIELSCGALSINPEIARESGKNFISPGRPDLSDFRRNARKGIHASGG